VQQHQRDDLHARAGRDYDQWAQLTGDETWSWRNTLPWFKLHEDHYKGANAAHGAKGTPSELLETPGDAADAVWRQVLRHHQAGGEWRVEKQRLRWDVLDAFALAAQQAGIAATDDFNRGDNEGVGYFEVNQRAGWRWNTAKAFLRPTCYARPNFDALDNGAGRPTGGRCAGADGPKRCTGAQVVERPGAGDGDRQARGHPLRRLHRHAADPAALGHRARRIAATARHCTCARVSRRGRQPAGPPADPRRIQSAGRADAQHAGQLALGQGKDRSGIRAEAKRPDEHGAQPARRVHAQLARPALTPTSNTTCSR
jgi:hypothetical protein